MHMFIVPKQKKKDKWTLPLRPKVGPWEGWRKQANTFFFNCTANAWHKPTVVVLFPSPSGVGVILSKNNLKIIVIIIN